MARKECIAKFLAVLTCVLARDFAAFANNFCGVLVFFWWLLQNTLLYLEHSVPYWNVLRAQRKTIGRKNVVCSIIEF